MQLLINGQASEMPPELTARQLIERLELAGKRIALEVNGEIIPRSTYETHNLREGDKIEIVHAIGGG
jgi:sulfur carrier protein